MPQDRHALSWRRFAFQLHDKIARVSLNVLPSTSKLISRVISEYTCPVKRYDARGKLYASVSETFSDVLDLLKKAEEAGQTHVKLETLTLYDPQVTTECAAWLRWQSATWPLDEGQDASLPNRWIFRKEGDYADNFATW